MKRGLILFLFTLATPGCARALHAPPPVSDLGGGGATVTADQIDSLLARAGDLFETREMASVREAASVWLTAARSNPDRLEPFLGAARSHVWLADHEPEAEERRGAARIAVQSAQWCERLDPASPACQYWMGAALGLQARERRSTGLDALPRIEEAFHRAATEEPTLERGGPDRALALLYVRAPGWPTGPGDPDRALEHARRAVSIDPDYPPNHLALGEALAATGEKGPSSEAYRTALDLARERLASGDPDAPEWIRDAEKALAGSTPP